MSKRHICKSMFHVCYYFLDTKIRGEKTLLILPVRSIIKWLTEIKNDKFLFSHFLVVVQEGLVFWSTKKKCEKKMSFFPLIPEWDNEG